MEPVEKKIGEDGVDCDVLIVGAGLSGILTAIRMKDAGIPLESMIMVDAADGVGGTWHWNNYPGCAVDNWSYAYLPFLDRTKFVPSKRYPPRDEINKYINLLVDNQGLRDILRLRRWVTSLEWSEADSRWIADMVASDTEQIDPYKHSDNVKPNETISARHVVLGGGPIAYPRKPDFPGLEKFKGDWLVTARYDQSVSLEGKRVAIVGVGCSCAQVIESIGYHDHPKGVKELLVFQRTPSYCVPRQDEPTPDDTRKQILEDGGAKIVAEYNAFARSFDPALYEPFTGNKDICDQIVDGIRATVKDPEVAEKLVPSPEQKFFAKRPLVMDHYYESYNNPKVKLIAEGGIVSADETGVVTKAGKHYEVDVVITGAGFDAFRPHVNAILGRNNTELNKLWGFKPDDTDYSKRHQKTLLGIHVPDFPNLYTVIGPQSLNPAAMVPQMSDCQAMHIVKVVKESLTTGKIVETTHEEAEKWTEECARQAEGTVWTTINNWYNKDGTFANSNNYWGTIPNYCKFVEERASGVHFMAPKPLKVS